MCYDSGGEEEEELCSPLPGKPRGAGVYVVRDRYGEYRACVDEVTGVVTSNRKDGCRGSGGRALLGHVNAAEGTCGSREAELLGAAAVSMAGDEVVVEDASGQVAGTVHLGKGTVTDAAGTTLAEVRRDGTLHGPEGSVLGSFEPFTFGALRSSLALYLVLLDPGLLSRREEGEDRGK